MKCKTCGEEHREMSNGDGEDPQTARAACRCERRLACDYSKECPGKVLAMSNGPRCGAHLPSGFGPDDFPNPISVDELTSYTLGQLAEHESEQVTCDGCKHVHADKERLVFLRRKVGTTQAMQVTGCPKCKSVILNLGK